jgi:hypothetical protein
MNEPPRRRAAQRAATPGGQTHAQLGRVGRITLAGVGLALLLSVAMGGPPKPLDPPAPVAKTYTIFLPIALNSFFSFSGPQVSFAYGWNVFQYQSYYQSLPSRPDTAYPQYAPSSFNWVKITASPPSQDLCGANRLPYNVLLRLNKTDANATAQQVADDTWQWAHSMETSPGVGKCVDAFEIGNEPNLSGQGQYNGAVDPVKYADQLCAAYDAIKSTDPSFIVVSAGLAPTGGAADHTLAMESLAFLRAMLDEIRANPIGNGDPGGCFDVLGYHNYGFRTGYQTDPRDAACPAEMCYRGAEDVWAVLLQYGITKRIWTTETGWMRDFVAGGCGSTSWAPIFAGFQMSDQAQSDNLVGAFQYARANWPWLGGIFVFNLDFNPPRRSTNPCYDEQGWFAVMGYPAQAALEAMTKTP